MRPFSRFAGIRAVLGGAALLFAFALVFYRAEIRAFAMHAVDLFREAGVLPFFAAMSILPAVGFPLSAFFVAAGAVYGPTLGPWHVVAYGTLAMVVNIALSYAIAAHPLRPFAARLANRAGYRLPEVRSDRAWKITLAVRIVPGVPFFIQSYLLGIARVSFGAYLLVSVLVEFVYLVSAVLLGTGLLTGNRKALVGAALIFVMIAVTLHILRKTWNVTKAK